MRSLSLLALAAVAPCQNVCDGNGQGSAFIRGTAAVLGSTLSFDFGSPAAPSSPCVLGLSFGFGPVVFPHPLIGTVCMDMFSHSYQGRFVLLDGAGRGSTQAALPASPALFGTPPFYAHAMVLEGAAVSISRTLRVDVELADSWRVVPGLQLGRAMHTATSLQRTPNDHRIGVLVAGGGGGNFIQPVATATTDVYDPFLRAFRAGPAMTRPRSGHTATLLLDGRVLIAGGADTGGAVTATAEIYDPATDTFAPTGSMSAARSVHAATRLPDGRVLVTGGLPDWTQATVPATFVARLNAALPSAETFDPATGTWTPVAGQMADRRAGHGQLALADGRVLIVSGINGGVVNGTPPNAAYVPTYTPSCQIFDPVANAFVATAALPEPRAFFGISRLLNGDVLLSGGIVANHANFGEAIAAASCEQWSAGTWNLAAAMPVTRSYHEQVTLPGGEVLAIGGMVGDLTTLASTELCHSWAGFAWSARTPIGGHPTLGTPVQQRGTQTATLLPDGSVLVVGGAHVLAARADAAVYYR